MSTHKILDKALELDQIPREKEYSEKSLNAYTELLSIFEKEKITPEILSKLYNSSVIIDIFGKIIRQKTPGFYLYFEKYDVYLEIIIYRDSISYEITEQYFDLVKPNQKNQITFEIINPKAK